MASPSELINDPKRTPFNIGKSIDLKGFTIEESMPLVIGLAAIEDVLPVEELWRRSRVDETWQESQWGVDEEAAAVAALKREEFLHAARFNALAHQTA